MTPERQQIKIAEACGIQTEGWWCPWCNRKVSPRFVAFDETHDKRFEGCGASLEPMPMPDYLHDWNAMRQAVASFWTAQRMVFLKHLDLITLRDGEGWFPKRIIESTLAQWAEAFLRTIGKWEDS